MAGPQIALQQQAARRSSRRGQWRISWIIENRGAHTICIFSVRLPHGRFKSDEHRFEPPLVLENSEAAEFSSVVHCDEPEGQVTENGFVIFTLLWRAQEWRIFARVRVAVDAMGEPHANAESITAQKVGFSGVLS